MPRLLTALLRAADIFWAAAREKFAGDGSAIRQENEVMIDHAPERWPGPGPTQPLKGRGPGDTAVSQKSQRLLALLRERDRLLNSFQRDLPDSNDPKRFPPLAGTSVPAQGEGYAFGAMDA